MADFILIEPSCDIHLALDGLPAAKRDLALRIFSGTPDPATNRNVIGDIAAADLQFDFFPLDQAIVRFTAATHTLTPLAAGTVHMQVRFLDPALPAQYHYLVARIQVHRKMNGWWFGNKSLSIFRDPDSAHGQASIYALFDREQPGGGEVGDITGHGYVDLNIDNTGTCSIDIDNLPSGRFRDRLRGMAVGGTVLRGELLGQNRSININVVNLGIQAADPLSPVLQREAIFSGDTSPSERHNILFLGEGFGANDADRKRFSEAVTKASHNLFDANRHAPYSLLKDSFNVWSHLQESLESGVTSGPTLNADGFPIPPAAEILPASGSPGQAYTLQDLLQLVGLPTAVDADRTLDDLKGIWNAAASIPRILGFRSDAVVENVAAAWKKMIPRGIPQACDSFYGIIHGRRWGERDSVVEDRADMVATPVAGAPDFDARRAALGRRVYRWYRPDVPANFVLIDPRRYAPEFHPLGLDQQGLNLLIDHIAKFADPKIPAANADHNVGRLWNANTPIDPAAQVRQINSAGLVCLFTNSEYKAGTANPLAMVRVSMGKRSSYTVEADQADPNIRPLNFRPKIETDYSIIVDILAHEFGHSFNLGDEYERLRGPGNARIERNDNLTFVDNIQVPPPAAGPNPDFPTPINPDQIKWAKLHRIERANMLVQRSTIQGNKIIVRLAIVTTDAEKARWALIKEKWRETKEKNVVVFLRKYKATQADIRQLPILVSDLHTRLTIESINDDGTFTLTGQPPPLEEFPAGSVLYVPKRDVAKDPLNLVESAVLLYMKSHRWKKDDNAFPLGVALTENHNKDDAQKSDPVSQQKDDPPDIPNFDKPCKGYKLIGLYEGGGTFTTRTYRPAGACKMRNQEGDDGEGEFCFVCKYLIVNRVDPSKHAELDSRFYPKKKSLPTIFGALPISLSDIH